MMETRAAQKASCLAWQEGRSSGQKIGTEAAAGAVSTFDLS